MIVTGENAISLPPIPSKLNLEAKDDIFTTYQTCGG
jgi:hypothetical protein